MVQEIARLAQKTVWIVSICVVVVVYFRSGWIVLPFMLLASHPQGRALLSNPLTSETRASAFAQCTGLNITLGAFYAAAIFASALKVCLI